MVCSFVPPYLLRQLAESSTLAIDERLRSLRATAPPVGHRARVLPAGPAWVVHSADHGSTLPGTTVRAAGDPDSGDPAVDEAATGITATLSLFADAFGRASYDGQGAPVSLTVHYERDYDNAFWDGTQLVFGDGDGRVFGRFTAAIDVLGHEFTHAVTEHTAGLAYSGQSGALNESMSDVFAACLKQRVLGQAAGEADWLIGAGLFLPGIDARGLRDMAAPGTAYDDPALGRDPQPDHLSGYVDTTDDNGGVHLNSGIANRAFQLAAVGIGGSSWEGAGPIWYAALSGGRVGPRTDFAGFALETVAVAGPHAAAVREAWATVGVSPRTSAVGAAAPSASTQRVSVRRTGGFAGLVSSGSVDLDSDDPRGSEVRALLDRIDLRRVAGGLPQPDRFVYAFDVRGARATVPEQHLTADLRSLVALLLDPPDLGDGSPPRGR